MKKSFSTTLVLGGLTLPNVSLAHCPLCTAGAGGLAVLAASLGISPVVVGVLIGAFALALGLWLAGTINKQYIPEQKAVIASIIFLSTVLPIMPLVQAFGPLYLSLTGDYGTLLHNTYTINLYILGVSIGALVMLTAAPVSRLLTKVRGTHFPFQGMIITFSLLIAAALVVQLLS